MSKRRWLSHIVIRALAHRKGRTALLVAVLTMASSLATALCIVSASMGERVAEETRRYGANLLILPEAARIEVGSGALRFGTVGEPAYLDQEQVVSVLAASGAGEDYSLHLKAALTLNGAELPCEGVEFDRVRRLAPWWQLRGAWPKAGEALVGTDLAARYRLKPGDTLALGGKSATLKVAVAGIVSTGGEEDGVLFLHLNELQREAGHPGEVSLVRLLVDPSRGSVKGKAKELQPQLSGAVVKELRQVGRTSEELLGKVQLLMLLVTLVVLVCAGSSVAGTMSATVLERGKEIGLMKAMGGTRWDLLRIFSAEALLLGGAAGMTGYLLGSAIAQFVARSVFAASAGFAPAYFPVALGVSLSLALAGSLGPLVSVFRLDPVQSLRGE
uniref:ABC3 transporter permease C-terminal domain-containing protein n=1 Tax=Geobacter sp. (strain M21) TaxID=443144 RepID=C6E618_GEOSM